MKKFISFGKIKHFEQISKDINHMAKYISNNNESKPIYNDNKNPVLTAIGSEKIHGTNFSVAYNNLNGIWFQSKKEIITCQHDNAGSAFFAKCNEKALISIIQNLSNEYKIDLNENTIIIYGEWAGDGIQKKSALDKLSKKYILFQHFKIVPFDEKKVSYWEETKCNEKWIDNVEKSIYNIMNFKTYEIQIDFENPNLYLNKMIDMVNTIEENSPVGKSFGIENNIGEGIVFSMKYKGVLLRWKVKGEKHCKTIKGQYFKKVDDVKEQKKIDIANKLTPTWRLEQMFDLSNDIINGGKPSIHNISNFIKMVISDIIDEESDFILKNGFEIKDIQKTINKISSKWYLQQL